MTRSIGYAQASRATVLHHRFFAEPEEVRRVIVKDVALLPPIEERSCVAKTFGQYKIVKCT
jgi:hypothetical protein